MASLPPLVLAYHGVAGVPFSKDRLRLFVAPAQLRRDIARLRSWGYEIVTFGDLARLVASNTGTNRAALTFDDGLGDAVQNLLPLLNESHARATVFVVTSWLGGRHPHASWAPILTRSQVRELSAAGTEIGVHTIHHEDLTTLPAAAVEEELAGCRAELEDLVGERVCVAAYPFGATNALVQHVCARAGLHAACSLMDGRWDEPFNLPRQPMANGSSATGLWLKRHGFFKHVAGLPGMRRAIRISRAAHSAYYLRRERHDRAVDGTRPPFVPR
jgi:peptidoglycan/xylan/chitin deacetylase (PgdA/CDA1 family)